MGCTVGKHNVRALRKQVDELQCKLKETEQENSKLKSDLDAGGKVGTAAFELPAALAASESPAETAVALAAQELAEGKLPQKAEEAEKKEKEQAGVPAEVTITVCEDATILPGTVLLMADQMSAGAASSQGMLNEGTPLEEASTSSSAAPQAVVQACHTCGVEGQELTLDRQDNGWYCAQCWRDYYGQYPSDCQVQPLVPVEVYEDWPEDHLRQAWIERRLPGWPQIPPSYRAPSRSPEEGKVWSSVNVCVRRGIVGQHSRALGGHPDEGEVLADRYRVRRVLGQGTFTKAFLADDLKEGGSVCLKCHTDNPRLQQLADLMVISKRLDEVDEGHTAFPQLIDVFCDVVPYTVEGLIQGQNCLAIAQSDASFFKDLGNVRIAALGMLHGLALLDKAGVVHNDVKPDNVIWIEANQEGASRDGDGNLQPCVKVVDFGCARLDQREESGRNWSLAEGGQGHFGKWSPEMVLKLPITTRGDVWAVAISLCELHCARYVWRSAEDTDQVVLTQALGLCDHRDGVPASLLKRSPLDVQQLFTPAPQHFPVRRKASVLTICEALRPSVWGLDQVLGEGWRQAEKVRFGELLLAALVIDPMNRPSATQLLECPFLAQPAAAVAENVASSAQGEQEEASSST